MREETKIFKNGIPQAKNFWDFSIKLSRKYKPKRLKCFKVFQLKATAFQTEAHCQTLNGA